MRVCVCMCVSINDNVCVKKSFQTTGPIIFKLGMKVLQWSSQREVIGQTRWKGNFLQGKNIAWTWQFHSNVTFTCIIEMPSTIKLCGHRSQCKGQMYILSASFGKKKSSQTPRPISFKLRGTMYRGDPNVKGQRSKSDFFFWPEPQDRKHWIDFQPPQASCICLMLSRYVIPW